MNLTFPGANGAARILAASAVAVNGPADASENILATITIPAGTMGANGIIRVSGACAYTNNANTKALRGRFGGIGGTAHLSIVGMSTETGCGFLMMVANRNATNSQFGSGHAWKYNNAMQASTGTGAVDTAAATTIVLTGQKAVGGDTFTLEHYVVELILP
jgi:hypothetical protein